MEGAPLKPCLIIRIGPDGFSAYNEDGRVIAAHYGWAVINEITRDRGFEPVSLNSRAGRTIWDKLSLATQMNAERYSKHL